MALLTGTKLGPYEIVAPLGAGGMGEVYRARDTRLGREVAIKVLPTHLAENSEAKQRFEREARAVSSLSHVNICALFDVGSQNGADYLVMEYLEGETLAKRLEKGPLKMEEVQRIGIEIAEALEKAHRQGVVHRDLKPANVMLTKAGAKLMDFGLAKPSVAMTAASDLLTPSGPTMSVAALTAATSPLTQKGMIVGTFQYIAPEVLQGKEADARSDIFSLGCVLFEMATGKRAFEGKSQLSVFTAILENEPPLVSSQQPVAPKALDEIVKKLPGEGSGGTDFDGARCEAAIARFRAAGGKRSDSRAGEDGDRSPGAKYSAWGGDLGVAGCSTVGICARWKEERRRSIAATNCAAGED